MSRLPIPPSPGTTAVETARLAEDGWNTRGPRWAALACGMESRWRNRAAFLHGHESIRTFPRRKWQREIDYRLIKGLLVFVGHRIAVRFASEWRDTTGLLQANTILRDARIATPDRHQRSASGLAVANGTFIDAGSNDEVMRHVVGATTVIDARGRVMRGLIDSHIHVIRGGFNDHPELRRVGIPSLASVIVRLREEVSQSPPFHWARLVAKVAVSCIGRSSTRQ